MKRLLSIFVCFAFIAISGCILFACGSSKDNINYNATQEGIEMIVGADEDSINFKISSDKNIVGEGKASVISAKAYQYFVADKTKGLSKDILKFSQDLVLRSYNLGDKLNFTIPRFTDDGEDNLYNKYYIVKEDKLLKGPVYATDIVAQNDEQPVLKIKSKKGIFDEGKGAYDDLNASYTVINFPINNLIYPNEYFDEDGNAIVLPEQTENVIEFASNGKKYYFNKALIEGFDYTFSKYYKKGAFITCIILLQNSGINDENFPLKMTYYPYSTQETSIVGLNTSNVYGNDYFIALMEFLADRYTSNNFEHGFVSNFIIGNEIDYSGDYNRISEKQPDLNTYMEEYSRLMRLANLAVKKYNKNITISIPLTQAWAKPGVGRMSYAPKDMLEWLNKKTKQEGDYDWALAPHSYGYNVPLARIFETDTAKSSNTGRTVGMTGDMNTTSKISFSNLELFEKYLNQDFIKYNGNTRKVHLVECGVSSFDGEVPSYGQEIQAATIATTWYKISQLDCITSYSYYRLIDHPEEVKANARFGLMDQNGNKKLAYEVYKYIDTQFSKEVAKEEYLQPMAYYTKSGEKKTYGNGISTYLDLLNIFETDYDFSNFDWNKAMPVKLGQPEESVNDKIDLSSVVFENKYFLYEAGAERSLEISGVPENVDVKYFDEQGQETTLTTNEYGKKTITAKFYKDEQEVGTRTATISNTRLLANKAAYNLGENIFVTINRTDCGLDFNDLTSKAWVGLYNKDATPGPDVSVIWCYINSFNDRFSRTFIMQKQKFNDSSVTSLTEGEYKLYLFKDEDATFDNVVESLDIKILPSRLSRQTVDLSGITLEDKSFNCDHTEKSLTITGQLPANVEVTYENNSLTEVGSVQVCAILKLKDGGKELERRYAVLTVRQAEDTIKLVSSTQEEKTQIYYGEKVYIKTDAPQGDTNYWVGLYDAAHEENDEGFKAKYNVSAKGQNIELSSVFGALEAGNYRLTLFYTSDYDVETSYEFEVIENEQKADLSVEKTQFNVGEEIITTVTLPTNIENTTYWVGIYNENGFQQGEKSLYYYYVEDETHIAGQGYNIFDGIKNDKNRTASLIGKFKIYLFITSGYTIVEEIDIQIGSDEEIPVLRTDKQEYHVGETITITVKTPHLADGAWIGLFKKDQKYSEVSLDYVYPKTTSLETITLSSEQAGAKGVWPLPVGEYKLVLFVDGQNRPDTVNYAYFTVVE